MILPLAVIVQLATACAPQVAPETLAAIAQTESTRDPLAIRDNTTHLSHRPRDKDEAVAIARNLISEGHNLDLGLMQINRGNFAWLGLTLEAAFDPCRSIAAGAAVLTQISRYNTGSPAAGFLDASVRARLTILLCGATGSGKTTLSKSLLAAIDPGERIITLEDTLELSLSQPNVVRLLYSKDGLSGASIDPEALLQASLRMRPDRVLLQELRDDAAWTYIGEVVSGHPGSITTIHGQDAASAFKRLFALCKSSPRGRNFDDRTLIDLLSAAVDLIIPLHNAGTEYRIGAAWFAANAARRGETAADLLRDL